MALIQRTNEPLLDKKLYLLVLNIHNLMLAHSDQNGLRKITKLAETYLKTPFQLKFHSQIEKNLSSQMKAIKAFLAINPTEIDYTKIAPLLLQAKFLVPYYVKKEPEKCLKLIYDIFQKIRLLQYEGRDIWISELITPVTFHNSASKKKESQNSIIMHKEMIHNLLPTLCLSSLKAGTPVNSHPIVHWQWLAVHTDFHNDKELKSLTSYLIEVGKNVMLQGMIEHNELMFGLLSDILSAVSANFLARPNIFIAALKALIDFTLYQNATIEKLFSRAEWTPDMNFEARCKTLTVVISDLVLNNKLFNNFLNEDFWNELPSPERVMMSAYTFNLMKHLPKEKLVLGAFSEANLNLSEFNIKLLEILIKFTTPLKDSTSLDYYNKTMESSRNLCRLSRAHFSKFLNADQQKHFSERIDSLWSLPADRETKS